MSNASSDSSQADGISGRGSSPPGRVEASFILYGVGTALAVIGGHRFYRRVLCRIPTSLDIPRQDYRRRYLCGKVTSVGDGDNFRLYHLPGGIFAGWGWLRKVPEVNQFRQLKNQTIHVRLCGVDAPERAHFGKPAQPFGDDALEWLRSYILGRRVYVKPLHMDQYNRTVSKVKVLKWNGYRDVSAEMIKAGMGTVYEAKMGAEYDGNEALYRKYEKRAKNKKKGMWTIPPKKRMSPREYKNKYS
ncbi:DEKNAAC100718 [Brettanomyces naardenensis]|uniref:Probable endonuclease LCL3 n=1 Tax=Brettanomyces naardenensis TaxID=13370 RepID=A0A448YFS1_BRENA|nr:DEKNAAC100718 [Brettanomyces naardenensis]